MPEGSDKQRHRRTMDTEAVHPSRNGRNGDLRTAVLQHHPDGDGSSRKARAERIRYVHRTDGIPEQRDAAGGEGFQGKAIYRRQRRECSGGETPSLRHRQPGGNGVRRGTLQRQDDDTGIGLRPAGAGEILSSNEFI